MACFRRFFPSSILLLLLFVLVHVILLIHVDAQGGGEEYFMNNGNCFDNLDDLFYMELDYKDHSKYLEISGQPPYPWQQRVYKLCRHTVFGVGAPTANRVGFVGGQFSLGLRGNMTVQCGDYGRSSDNCILEQADPYVGTQLLVVILDYYNFEQKSKYDLDVDGAHLKGVTFGESALGIATIGAGSGIITFEDVQLEGLRATPSFIAIRWNNAYGYKLTVRFINCRFENNRIINEPIPGTYTHRNPSPFPNNMIMTEEHWDYPSMPGQGIQLEFDRCIFRDNDFSEGVLKQFYPLAGTALISHTGNVSVTNSCFVANRLDPFLGEMIFAGKLTNKTNNFIYEPKDAPLPGRCRFVYEVNNFLQKCQLADRDDFCPLMPDEIFGAGSEYLPVRRPNQPSSKGIGPPLTYAPRTLAPIAEPTPSNTSSSVESPSPVPTSSTRKNSQSLGVMGVLFVAMLALISVA